MQVSDEIHEKKIEMIRAITDVMARHGNGFNWDIDNTYLVVTLNIVHREGDKLIGREKYCFYPTSHSYKTYEFVTAAVEKMLKRLGAEFVSIREIKEDA